ncbi:hypothetical protein RIF29_24288 [Crotalaria pallida]|uniref:Uncharacterized protein n=1 Tax=Crotalaria pallida TaxID=3830 RepID=A0AAN9ELY3_CROPI
MVMGRREEEEEEVKVKLPMVVERMIERICVEQKQNPPDSFLRTQLAAISEEQALSIHSQISKSKIRKTFSGYLQWLLTHSPSSPSSSAEMNPDCGLTIF